MADKKQNPLVVFGLIAVIAIAAIFIVRGVIPERHPEVEMPPMSWICMACNHRTPVVEEPVIECPECGEPAMAPADMPMPPEPLPPAE